MKLTTMFLPIGACGKFISERHDKNQINSCIKN